MYYIYGAALVLMLLLIGVLLMAIYKKAKVNQKLIEENRFFIRELMANDQNVMFNFYESRKMLSVLQHAVFIDVTEHERHLLINFSDELMWKIAEKFNIDWNNQYVEVHTLDVKDIKTGD
jgi:hypothetical protein